MSDWPGWTLAVLSCGCAAGLLRPPRSEWPAVGRARRKQKRVRMRRMSPSAVGMARPAAVLAGGAVAAASHPVAGLLVGSLAWWLLPPVAGRLETKGEAALREELTAQLPLAAGLLSSCLAAGAPLVVALTATAEALAEPARSVLRRGAQTVALGGGPAELATALAQPGEPGWQSLAAAVVRSSRTGAPLAGLLHEAAEQAQRSWAADASVKARSAAVRTVLPLALCYLPAFLLLGIAPLIAGLLGDVRLW